MPAYGSSTPATLESGRPTLVWNNENVPTSGAAQMSQAVCLRRNPNLPNCVSVEVIFAANPGTFGVDLQAADTDQDSFYVTKATLNSGLNGTFAGRIEATNLVAKFLRLRMATLTNNVKVTAKFF
jgi:hypothetical protein